MSTIDRALSHAQHPTAVQRALFGDGSDQPPVRHDDPPTSRAAARRERGHVRAALIEAFTGHGPLTDDEACAHVHRILDDHGTVPDSTIKTLRSRLTKREGILVDSGDTGVSNAGSRMTRWALHPSLRPTVTVRDPHGRVA